MTRLSSDAAEPWGFCIGCRALWRVTRMGPGWHRAECDCPPLEIENMTPELLNEIRDHVVGSPDDLLTIPKPPRIW